MRKFVLFFALMASFTLTSLAQISSSVVVFSQEGEKFYLIVDGIRQNETPQTNVKVTGLSAPNYLFKVIFENESIPSIDQNVMTKDVDNIYQDITYVVKKNNKGVYVMRVNSFAAAQGNIAPEPNQYAAPLNVTATAPTGTVQTQTQTVTTTVDQNAGVTPNGASMNLNVVDPATGDNVNLNMNVNMNVTGAQTQTSMTTTTVTTTTTTNVVDNGTVVVAPAQPDHYIMQGYNGPIGCPWPMNESDFAAAQQTINSKSFESDKLTIAKQVLGSNCMTSDQVKWVMTTFSFEDSKLDFAKFAYGHVYDPGNYYRVNDAFTFSSSIDELNEYITGRH